MNVVPQRPYELARRLPIIAFALWLSGAARPCAGCVACHKK
jgi:hypothetical protein